MGWAKRAMTESEGEEEGGLIAALREHLPMMGKIAMALVGDAARVADILEDAARDAAKASEPPPSAKPWLLGLVRSASAKQLSKLPIKTRGFESVPSTQRVGGAATAARTALASLRPTEREAVVLSILGRLNADDLAVACNVDVQTAKTRLARGLEQMLAAEEGATK